MSFLCYNSDIQLQNWKGASLVWIQQQIATLFGLGRCSKAPGTLGSLAAIPLWWALSLGGPNFYLIATFLICLLGIWVSSIYVTMNQVEDPAEVVIDEVAGFLITMAWLPVNWYWLVLGFTLFRVLDILKPFPISVIDRKVKGGLGVMADDLLAGVFASIILQVLYQSGVLLR